MSVGTEVYLFRHGAAINSVIPNRVFGQSDDIPLLPNGEVQSRQLGAVLVQKGVFPDAVYASPAVRARRTGELALDAMGLHASIITEPFLHEQSTGDWTGGVATDIFTEEMVRAIEAEGKDFRAPNGESMNNVGDRVIAWLDSLEDRYRGGNNVVFGFSHGGAIRCAVSRMLNWNHAETYGTKPANTSVTSFVKQNGIWAPEHIAINADQLPDKKNVPNEIGSRLITDELIRSSLRSVIWFGSVRNNQDVHSGSDYDVQVVLDKPDPEVTLRVNGILRDYPDVDLSIVYTQDIFDQNGGVIFQDGTKGPFFMHVLAAGKTLFGENVYAEVVDGMTFDEMRPSILFTIREYLSRLRVMAAQSPEDTAKFQKYSLKLFKDIALYSGAVPLENMTHISNVDAKDLVTEAHAFSERSRDALSSIEDYDRSLNEVDVAYLLQDYEQIVEGFTNAF